MEMITIFKITSYAALVCIYLYLNRLHFRKLWRQYKKFSIKRFLGFVSYIYQPINHHWFYKKEVHGQTHWHPFSTLDSLALEEAFNSTDLSSDKVLATDGGRYDVNILSRRRYPIYWNAEPNEVRRCSWFHKSPTDRSFVPYHEITATMLENEFRKCFETNQWHRKIELPDGDFVIFQRPDVLVLLPPTQPYRYARVHTPQTHKSGVLKRGVDEIEISKGEPLAADHLLLMVHGIGSFCDLKFRTVEEVVDDFRSIALQLVESHYGSSRDNKVVSRIEVLPINWHAKLHSQDTGVDERLKNITLPSVPILRGFINDTLSDILFYRSPKYCQIILTAVGVELNRIYELFKQRNPSFNGSIFLAGHSLGSLILFDVLCYQQPKQSGSDQNGFDEDDDTADLDPSIGTYPTKQHLSPSISAMILEAGIHQPPLEYPQLHFQPIALFALGSPIGMFVTTTGLDKLGDDFALPTCPGFFNIFHPYDPVANRIETLINPQLVDLEPVLLPHHKGGKRMHLQLRETMSKVKADLREKWKQSVNTFCRMGLLSRRRNSSPSRRASETDTIFEEFVEKEQMEQNEKADLNFGILNKGRRIDYVLQEAPIESFNEYIFALTLSSHLCYWESEDTILLILKEIYGSMGIDPGDQVGPSSSLSSPKRSDISTSSAKPSTFLYLEPSLAVNLDGKAQQ